MPKATAVCQRKHYFDVQTNCTICNSYELEIKGIVDGDVAKGIKAYNPILAGQLSREEIEKIVQKILKKLQLLKDRRGRG